jgi:hypothetical protein
MFHGEGRFVTMFMQAAVGQKQIVTRENLDYSVAAVLKTQMKRNQVGVKVHAHRHVLQ